jgi:hypothetical protein
MTNAPYYIDIAKLMASILASLSFYGDAIAAIGLDKQPVAI